MIAAVFAVVFAVVLIVAVNRAMHGWCARSVTRPVSPAPADRVSRCEFGIVIDHAHRARIRQADRYWSAPHRR